ncbi:Fe-S cluster assembly protein SufB [Oceanivirga miroungae]|uniref:FeS assembly protein SufB n=1 Tax=Oceanivirga miroungae TaxID=1130046 RepID=A0A6I8MDE2_9FUSO|nr:Fe-S cluster assembly protein SufB [Oceanivirga miroungae]VWL85184.1 FeS assembly protein SufB [Oceanivirga miroungae]
MSEKKKRTYVEDIERGVYDIKDEVRAKFSTGYGVNEEVVKKISDRKNEPSWMLELRLKGLEEFNKRPMPMWSADLSKLDINEIISYLEPDANESDNWEDVPAYIKNTFDRLGIPEAEKKTLGGVGAQYDSNVVYHKLNEELEAQGIIYLDIETALKKYPEIVKKYFMKLIPINDHKFSALHAAVWSGGTFLYIPKGVKVEKPIQSYFRLNAPEAGQYEHTIIIVEDDADVHFIEGCSAPKYQKNTIHAGAVELYVGKRARLRYSSIENWSKNMYNLNTKRAEVDEDGVIEWISGSFGSKVSMLYPMSILKGERSRSEYTGVSFAGKGQYIDSGCKVLHAASYTSSKVNSKSISKDGGWCNYRSLLKVLPGVKRVKATAECESLMLDDMSKSDTIPTIVVNTDDIDIGHEASIGRISDDAIFYLMQRGLTADEAKAMIIRGFVEPITKELPLEYAVELNRLIEIELEGTIG